MPQLGSIAPHAMPAQLGLQHVPAVLVQTSPPGHRQVPPHPSLALWPQCMLSQVGMQQAPL
jgi:hypothetical protein